MFYTLTHPAHQTDRIDLHLNAEVTWAGAGWPVFAVAVRFDAMSRRVIPLWTDPDQFDSAWTTPAELHADGSITAKGPIPESLFLRSRHATHLGPWRSKDMGRGTERTGSDGEGAPHCVLVVEDEPPTLHALVRLLRSWGYTTLEALDGGEALDQVRKFGERLNVVLLDIMLPVLDGVGVARWLLSEWPELPIVVCSAALNAELEAELSRLGVREFLSKPFRAEALQAALLQVA